MGLLFGLTLPLAVVAQGEPVHKLRIVGGLAALNQYTRQEEPFWTRELPKLSGGKAVAEIVAFDRAGIRGEDMLRLLKLGVVPFGTVLMSLSAIEQPVLAAPDLAGLNPDLATLKRNVAAFRPYLQKTLSERYGIELLAVYIYPAQVAFCDKPFSSLSDLAGRRVRTSGASQSDLVEALGGVAVRTSFAEIMSNMRSGNTDCAITGTMSGNTIGLHQVTTHVHSTAITWGLSVFAANAAAWQALAPDVRALLIRELPRLERNIWSESDRETGEGTACNTGSAECTAGTKGAMVRTTETPQDERRRRELFASTVLSRWIQRCGPECAEVWNRTIGPIVGVPAPAR